MLTETCQLLSTAVHLAIWRGAKAQHEEHGAEGEFPYPVGHFHTHVGRSGSVDLSWLYKPTHVHGEAVAWAGASRQNFQWLVDYAVALANEYQLRYPGGTHKALACAWRFMAGREYLGQLFGWNHEPYTDRPAHFYDGAANGQLGLDFRSHADGPHAGYRAYLNARYALSTRRSAPRWSSPASKPAWVVS